jgi:transcriptional regulator with XRE-family HTH domain
MEAPEFFAQRVRRLRVSRGLSERELAERIGMTVHQYESLTSAGMSPTCSLIVNLADALDVSITELTEQTVEAAPPGEEMEAFLQERRRTSMISGTRAVDLRLAKVDEALEMQPEPNADALNASIALMRAIERNEPVRAVAGTHGSSCTVAPARKAKRVACSASSIKRSGSICAMRSTTMAPGGRPSTTQSVMGESATH